MKWLRLMFVPFSQNLEFFNSLLAIRSISLVMTAVFFALYILAFRSDNKKYTERDGLTIREEAEQQMIASGLSIDQLKRIIEEGKVKQLGPRSRRVAEIDGYIYSVLLDNRGRVLEVSG